MKLFTIYGKPFTPLEDGGEELYAKDDITDDIKNTYPHQQTTPTEPTLNGSAKMYESQGCDGDLYLYKDDIANRPRISKMINSLANYNATIPSSNDTDAKVQAPSPALGTLMGVYLPCMQNILGVILFIRMPWIVGTSGALLCFTLVSMCCCTTFLTGISMSAIATNGVVPGGGAYFMISRSLGPEFGGAVGILFFTATTIAGSMYIIGAVEILLVYICPVISIFGDVHEDPRNMFNNFRVYGTVLLLIMVVVVSFGVKLVNKFATVALLCVFVSIVSIFLGIFANVNGTDKMEICTLGPRLLIHVQNCSQEPYEELWNMYCQQENGTIADDIDLCDPYFASHNVSLRRSIPGLASGVFAENVGSNFLSEGQIVADSSNIDDYEPLSNPTFNQVLIDTTASFTILVGIFFPSVTGIMAGSNRSGDLADAQKSIPVGTLGAIVTTSFLYLLYLIFFAGTYDNLLMRDKYGQSVDGKMAVASLCWPTQWIVLIGSLLSTIGAGLQTLTGAPRLLQAIAKDNLIPILAPFSVSSAKKEPLRALCFSACLCEVGILIGNLDNIAPILSMFFLMCYGFVNLACALQTLLQTPNWRPRFKYYHWSLSFIGLALCVTIMFMTSWYYALIAMLLAGAIYKYIEFTGAEKEWGDGIRGLALSAASFSLLRLEEGPPHTKNWRPQVLILSKPTDDLLPKYPKLFTFAEQLKAGKGLTIAVSVIEGEYHTSSGKTLTARQHLRRAMNVEKVKGFVDALVANDVSEGISQIVQTCGLGGMKPNTVILGWPYGWRHSTDAQSWRVFLNTVRNVSAANMALLVPKGINYYPDGLSKVSGQIDIWWIVHDGGLLMLLPFLLKQHKVWNGCNLRIFTVAQQEDDIVQMKRDLKMFLYHLRIEAEVDVVRMHDGPIKNSTYQRTLIMEQRSEILSKIQRNISLKSEKTEYIPHDNSVVNHLEDDSVDIYAKEESIEITPLHKPHKFNELLLLQPNETNVKRMHTAVRLNEMIVNRSHSAQLAIINLPSPPKINVEKESNYMELLEVLTEGLERVLMVRGGGREVITIYS